MKVYLTLYYNWMDPDLKPEVVEEVEGGPFAYNGIPPAVGDEVEWHPDKFDDEPHGVYVVFKRRLVVGRRIEKHWIVSARWASSE